MSSVVLDESQYFKDDLCQKHYLDFKNNIDNGVVTIIATTAEDVQHILEKAIKNGFDIHAGEAESLSAMLKSEYSELYFCTADKRAVIVAHLFDLLDRVISLEKCLGKNAIHLTPKVTEKVMQRWKAEAIQKV